MANQLKDVKMEQLFLLTNLKECNDANQQVTLGVEYFKYLKEQYQEHDVAYNAIIYIQEMKNMLKVVSKEVYPYLFTKYLNELSKFEMIYARDEMLYELIIAYKEMANLSTHLFSKINYLTKSNQVMNKLNKITSDIL